MYVYIAYWRLAVVSLKSLFVGTRRHSNGHCIPTSVAKFGLRFCSKPNTYKRPCSWEESAGSLAEVPWMCQHVFQRCLIYIYLHVYVTPYIYTHYGVYSYIFNTHLYSYRFPGHVMYIYIYIYVYLNRERQIEIEGQRETADG